ncbi:hypothetical protein BpHYR1_035250 [Brachionus plicatilis]|uniref:Uncharacterized protein n=1 Tax=Brachionus plicatilis TaxID=10195 RepID=A0A3M7Q7V6_BRAPC|nr:hypothetical protein BpHYR1_035250 [Brachionus plicatilis]
MVFVGIGLIVVVVVRVHGKRGVRVHFFKLGRFGISQIVVLIVVGIGRIVHKIRHFVHCLYQNQVPSLQLTTPNYFNTNNY